MQISPSLLEKLLNHIREKYGSDLSTPKSFLCLSLDIHAKCKDNVSVATIKRIFGYVKYGSSPSVRTLNIFANYIGYRNYEEFYQANMPSPEPHIFICGIRIRVGDLLNVELPEGKGVITLQYKGNQIFRLL